MRSVLIIICSLLLAIAVATWSYADNTSRSFNLNSSTMPAKPGNRGKTITDEMDCLLEPHMIANVGSPVEGTLAQILVERGADVRVGQVLARLHSGVEQASLNLKRAQFEFDQRKVQRNDELFRKNLIAASDKDELETQTRVAELDVKQQQEVLNLRTIVSPLNGVVTERFLAPGDHVAQEKILRVAQINPLNIEVVVPVELFGLVHAGMSGDITVEPLLHGSYKAKVVMVDRVIDAGSATFGVRLELANPGNRIPSGLKCALRFGAPSPQKSKP